MTREEIIDRLWLRAEPKVYVTKDEFVHAYDDWQIDAVDVAGMPAFAVLTKGPEIHYDSLSTGKMVSRRDFAAQLQKVIDREGYAITRTPHEATAQHRINKRFGAVEIGRDRFDVHYRWNEVKPCRQ